MLPNRKVSPSLRARTKQLESQRLSLCLKAEQYTHHRVETAGSSTKHARAAGSEQGSQVATEPTEEQRVGRQRCSHHAERTERTCDGSESSGSDALIRVQTFVLVEEGVLSRNLAAASHHDCESVRQASFDALIRVHTKPSQLLEAESYIQWLHHRPRRGIEEFL